MAQNSQGLGASQCFSLDPFLIKAFFGEWGMWILAGGIDLGGRLQTGSQKVLGTQPPEVKAAKKFLSPKKPNLVFLVFFYLGFLGG